MVDGNLLLGKDGNATEFGHITVDQKGEMICGCGCNGHWEAYCSEANIPSYTKYLLSKMNSENVASSLLYKLTYNDPQLITAKVLFESAKSGDKISKKIVIKIG